MKELTLDPERLNELESASATLGIDVEKASPKELYNRIFETLQELRDCYNPGDFEHGAITDIGIAVIWLYGKLAPMDEVLKEVLNQ